MGARTDTAEPAASAISAGLLTHIVFALVVGVAVGVIAATTAGTTAIGSIGIVFGVAVGLVGIIAVPALVRL